MSPVGHSIVGLSFAVIAMPSSKGLAPKAAVAIAFVALASLPDWPLPNWGHDRYDVSHSLYVNLFLVLCLAAVTFRRVGHKMLLLAAGAWLSHLLLDSFYNHGNGIAIFWPLSDGRLNLAMPWFDTLDLSQSIFSMHNVSVYFVELFAYAPILAVTITLVRFRRCRCRNRIVDGAAAGFPVPEHDRNDRSSSD